MLSRREALGAILTPPLAGTLLTTLDERALGAAIEAADFRPPAGSPVDAARDEDFWAQIGAAFPVDRSIINLNNGGVSPSPGTVLAAQRRHVAYSNEAPPYTMWKVLEPQRETVRTRLAAHFGVDPETIALTRNASEGLQACQLGLDLKRGDQVLTSTQDYERMRMTFRQRRRREAIGLREVVLPVPAESDDAIVARFEAAITRRTRMILVSRVINLTGQVLPVSRITALGRARDIPVVVDGAHGLAHTDDSIADLDIDIYASSLHKWLFAPHGTGLLHVRREHIGSIWPLMAAAPKQDEDIRKFEEIGTHPAAPYLAIAEALTFHERLGGQRKLARLVALRDHWLEPLGGHERVTVLTDVAPGRAGGIATISVDGVNPSRLTRWLWVNHRIIVAAIVHPEFSGIRVSPSVYTSRPELDRFVEAMETVLRGDVQP